MSLTIDSIIIAEMRVQGALIRSVVGAYELIFLLHLTTNTAGEKPRRATIWGARVSVKGVDQGFLPVGFARPEQPISIRQFDFPSSMTPTLTLSVQAGQLAALETLRGTSDLDFELLVLGTGESSNGEQQIQDTCRLHVSRSNWIKKLHDARARNILLLEVPLPISETSQEWEGISNSLRRAEEQFRLGDYHACIASCRTVVQELGFFRFKDKNWAGLVLARMASDRNGMTKEEREAGMWGCLRHYTHQAHHGDNEGGFRHYTRADAQLVLTLTASFVSHVQGDLTVYGEA